MDPNFVQATLSGYLASSHGRDRHPLHPEQEMVVYKPSDRGSQRSWMTAMRVRIGAGFIPRIAHQSQRNRQMPSPPATIVTAARTSSFSPCQPKPNQGS